MKNPYLTENQSAVIRDLALTMLQKGQSRTAVLARVAARLSWGSMAEFLNQPMVAVGVGEFGDRR